MLIQIWSGRTLFVTCIPKMISTLYQGLGLGCLASIVTEAMVQPAPGTSSKKLLVFNEMVTTRQILVVTDWLKA